MQTKSLQTKMALHTALLVLLLSVAGMGKGYAYDFSAVCPTGQTLYYNITDATNHYVELTYPGTAFNFQYWTGFTEPIGDIVLSESVSYQGINYSVTSIGECAFAYCEGLTGSLTIPNSVTTIGYTAFRQCSGFTGILTIPNSVTTIGHGAFMECSGFTGNLIIPENVISIGGSTFLNCNGFTGDLTIPNSVTTIGELAFSGCRGFTGTLTIPNSVTSIDFYAFSNCNGFSEVHYNATNCADFSTNGYISYPFSGCGGSLTIGDNVERIPAYLL